MVDVRLMSHGLLTCRCMAVSPLRTAAVVVCVASISGPEDDDEASEASEASGAAAVCCCKMELKETSALKFHPMQQISDMNKRLVG